MSSSLAVSNKSVINSGQNRTKQFWKKRAREAPLCAQGSVIQPVRAAPVR